LAGWSEDFRSPALASPVEEPDGAGCNQLETFKVFATLYGFADSIRQITTCIGLPIIFLESYSSIGQSAASIVTYIKEGEIS